MNLENIISFTKFTHEFQKIVRTIYVTGESRNENDLEHAGQLALLAWYIAETNKLKLDHTKLIKYALAHDLVEVYAGDTFFHTKDKKHAEAKIEREKEALEKIKQTYPEFVELHEYIENYETKKDRESKFIYALDKMLPVLNIYIDGGRSWKRDKVTLAMIKTKDEKIALSQELVEVWQELVEILEKNEVDLFGKT